MVHVARLLAPETRVVDCPFVLIGGPNVGVEALAIFVEGNEAWNSRIRERG